MSFRAARIFRLASTLFLAALLVAAVVPPASAQGTTPPVPCSYNYTVRPGDTWNTVSAATGVAVRLLRQANPSLIRSNGWLYLGDTVCVPAEAAAGEGRWYTVVAGDTWNTVSRATGISVRTLWNANPGLVNPKLWLYIGQQVWIPALPVSGQAPAAAVPEPTAAPVEPTVAPTEAPPTTVPIEATPTATATLEPTATVTPEPTMTATPEPTATATAAPTVAAPEATATETPVAAEPTAAAPEAPAEAGACPADVDAYPDAVLAYLNTAGNTVEGLQTWLASCKALAANEEGLVQAALQGPESNDLILTMHDPTNPPPAGRGQFVVYHAGATGYTVAYQLKGDGIVSLLQSGDLNGDGQADLVWADTVCGAHTCFSTLHVNSWDGTTYQDWMEGEDPTIASAEFKFGDVTPDGSGQEITIHGGVIGSVGAGPQRAWTETYISPQGGAYSLSTIEYDASTCLYHAVLDANNDFAAWNAEGFDPAIQAYTGIIADTTSIACSTTGLKNELAMLKDFARFRLVVAYVGAGQAAEAQKVSLQIKDKALAGAAKAFYDAYRSSGSVIQACRDTTAYAEKNPATWQFLEDWGYANPTFTAKDLCPLD